MIKFLIIGAAAAVVLDREECLRVAGASTCEL